MYDLLIKNGHIYDGTGSPAYVADVAVRNGNIVAIGNLEGVASKTVDARNLAVCPGFIDLHTHSDISFLLDSTAQSKVRQGVTLEVAGNCGNSVCAPLIGSAVDSFKESTARYTDRFEITWNHFGGYIDAIEQAGATLNLAFQVGHSTVRQCVMGMDSRLPDGDELDQMKRLVADSLDAGALGLSTGLFYAPGNYAGLEEVIELSTVVAKRNKLYSTHLRDEGSQSVGLMVALNEAIEVGRRTGVRVEISHVKCKGPAVWGRAEDILDLFERSRREGIDIAGDQYPYTASSNGLTGALFPRWSLVGGRQATLSRMSDPVANRRIVSEMEKTFHLYGGSEKVVIARLPSNPGYEGLSLRRIADELNCSPAEAALQIYARGDGQVVVHALSEQDMDVIAAHPLISVASDGSSLSTEGVLAVGKPHPRSYGTYPRFIAQFVRKKKRVALTQAIRRMTMLPASRLGLTHRGRIAPGFAADLVVFAPDTVADTASFESPHSYPVGIPHVIVNGSLVIEDGEFTGKKPGKVIRDFDG